MPTQSAQELEARLEATLREIGGTDLDFVLALEREMEGAAPCGLKRRWNFPPEKGEWAILKTDR